MRLNVAIIIAALTGLVVSIVMTLGHTLAVIELRQQHEDEAIRCMLDQACIERIRARQEHDRVNVPRFSGVIRNWATSSKVRLAAWSAAQTLLAIGFGYVAPVTSPLSEPELRLRQGLTAATAIIAIAGHFVKASHGFR